MSVTRIPEKVKSLLWAKSAGRCEFDGCNEPLWRDGLTQLEMNFGDVAHIIGDRYDGPRGHTELSTAYCADISNLMLMCQKHHRMIDQILEMYPDDLLRQMKRNHEERMELLTEIKPDKTSHVLIFKCQVGSVSPKIDFRDAWSAMFPEWYPTSRMPIELGMENCAYEDYEEQYWQIHSTNLERQFSEKIKPIVTRREERNHLSVFAFAPQPLLIKLGALLSDLYPATVYQLHREPSTWQWQPGPIEFVYTIKEPETAYPQVALNLSLSGTIDSHRIESVFAKPNYSEWQMTVASPSNDFLRSREQLQLFRQEFRTLLDRIKAKHGEAAVIHVFPAVPISVAVELGRVRQPKADLPFVIYDQNRKSGGFMPTLTIGDIDHD
jgi:hypothetical protein